LVGRNNDDRHAPDHNIETAILRTCKAVYIEAEPVLYNENSFTVAINFKAAENTQDNGGDSSSCIHYHYISITRPGHSDRYFFFQDDDFAGRRGRFSDNIIGAQEVIAALCMILSGRARLKTLRIILLPSHAGLEKKDLAKICWPLVFVNVPVKFWFEKHDVAVDEKLHEVAKGSYAESQVWRRLVDSYPHRGPIAPGFLIAFSRARAARLVKQHNKDWDYLRNIDVMMSEIVRCIVDIETYDHVCAYVKACEALQSYVSESEQVLRSLEKMANDDPQAFPSRYMDYKRRGMLTGGWAWQRGVGGWS
jgi:hypothetical protein